MAVSTIISHGHRGSPFLGPRHPHDPGDLHSSQAFSKPCLATSALKRSSMSACVLTNYPFVRRCILDSTRGQAFLDLNQNDIREIRRYIRRDIPSVLTHYTTKTVEAASLDYC